MYMSVKSKYAHLLWHMRRSSTTATAQKMCARVQRRAWRTLIAATLTACWCTGLMPSCLAWRTTSAATTSRWMTRSPWLTHGELSAHAYANFCACCMHFEHVSVCSSACARTVPRVHTHLCACVYMRTHGSWANAWLMCVHANAWAHGPPHALCDHKGAWCVFGAWAALGLVRGLENSADSAFQLAALLVFACVGMSSDPKSFKGSLKVELRMCGACVILGWVQEGNGEAGGWWHRQKYWGVQLQFEAGWWDFEGRPHPPLAQSGTLHAKPNLQDHYCVPQPYKMILDRRVAEWAVPGKVTKTYAVAWCQGRICVRTKHFTPQPPTFMINYFCP